MVGDMNLYYIDKQDRENIVYGARQYADECRYISKLKYKEYYYQEYYMVDHQYDAKDHAKYVVKAGNSYQFVHNGILYRPHQPSNISMESYMFTNENGKCHSYDDSPAHVYYNRATWFNNGIKHRYHAPAERRWIETSKVFSQSTDDANWYINGKNVNKKEYLQFIKDNDIDLLQLTLEDKILIDFTFG